MKRRAFLKTLAALAGVSTVPALGVALPRVPEPVWIVEDFDFGFSLGVGAKWPDGLRHAVAVDGFGKANGRKKEREMMIAYSKQALRQWYVEKHILKKAA